MEKRQVGRYAHAYVTTLVQVAPVIFNAGDQGAGHHDHDSSNRGREAVS